MISGGFERKFGLFLRKMGDLDVFLLFWRDLNVILGVGKSISKGKMGYVYWLRLHTHKQKF